MPPETVLGDKTRACSRPLPIRGAYDMVFKSFFAAVDCVIHSICDYAQSAVWLGQAARQSLGIGNYNANKRRHLGQELG